LAEAIERQVKTLQRNKDDKPFVFGKVSFSKETYLTGLRRFAELARTSSDREAFLKSVEKEFDFYEVYGDKEWGDIFLSSYYSPEIKGSLKPTKEFSQPLYKTPRDLLALDLAAFDPKFENERKFRAKLNGGKVVPYYTREEIDGKGALKGKRLELAWVDPIDAFDLQVQGSGIVDLGRGKKLTLGYAEKNGQRYESIGKFLREFIKPEDMNFHTIVAHLRGLPEAEMRAVLYNNPSYVFFKQMETDSLTSLGFSATDGRTIAIDQRYFPKGAIAFLSSTKPRFSGTTDVKPVAWEDFGRFVLDQDVGGAILGGGRVDLFWGRGNDARRYAGVMKQRGRLYYIAPKQ
jgi:membrane-bound lytic murein transglycosylase A